jgi:hypothetical protein
MEAEPAKPLTTARQAQNRVLGEAKKQWQANAGEEESFSGVSN